MKFSANPLVVAVALGLLGPQALVPDSEESDTSTISARQADVAGKVDARRREAGEDDDLAADEDAEGSRRR